MGESSTRQEILDAARALLLAEGPEAISSRRIAKAIHRSPMVVYRHFADMGDIVRQLADEGYAMLAEAFERISSEDPLECLRDAGREYLEFAVEHPAYYRAMFQLEEKRLGDGTWERTEQQQRTYDYILSCIQLGIEQGQITPGQDFETITYVLWSAVHGAASLMLAGRLELLTPEKRGVFVDTLIEAGVRILKGS